MVGMGGEVRHYCYVFRRIEHEQVGMTGGEFVHPGLFEADVADAQVGYALAQLYQLLGGGIISLGTAALGNHALYGKVFTGNGFGEVTQGLERDG